MRVLSLTTWILAIFILIQSIRAYNELDKHNLLQINKLSTNRLSLNGSDPNNHFKHLNKTRTPGSKGSLEVQQYILDHFKSLNKDSDLPWEIEVDKFEENGINFTNLVFSKRPIFASKQSKATNYLVIAAHYDSLIQPNGFIGAIDSAVSCGIILDIAQSVSKPIDKWFTDYSYYLNLGIKFVFFDGEEAIERWTPTDSIYGARHLYSKWEAKSIVKGIDLFVLLDLLGAPDVNYIPSYFPNTHDNYNDLSLLEDRLIQLFPSTFGSSYQGKYLSTPKENYEKEFRGFIEDDHLPFLKAGVPVLHLIPHVFPRQWHTIDDDFNHIDIQAVERWNLLLRAYLLEYFEIPELFTEE